MNRELMKNVTMKKVQQAVFGMGRLKSPGPDGFFGIFYQNHWDIIKHDVYQLVRDVFISGYLPPKLNVTTITLIPKGKHPKTFDEFFPISCCNYIYKVI